MKPLIMGNNAGLISIIGGLITSWTAAAVGMIDTHLLISSENITAVFSEIGKVAFFGAIGGGAGWLIKEILTYCKNQKSKS